MSEVKKGSKVKVHYTGKLTDGTVFDSSIGKDPLEFTVGEGQLIAGFDEGVVGMKIGDKKTVKMPPEKAYGHYDPAQVVEVPKSQFPADAKLIPGQEVHAKHPSGAVIPVKVVKVMEKTVSIDVNPPLAGKELTFEIEMVEIK